MNATSPAPYPSPLPAGSTAQQMPPEWQQEPGGCDRRKLLESTLHPDIHRCTNGKLPGGGLR